MKAKKISILVVAIMLFQLLSTVAFAETNPVVGFNADTSGIYLYGSTLTTDMLEDSVLKKGAETVNYTVSEIGITEAMENYSTSSVTNMIPATSKVFKLAPVAGIETGQVYSLSVKSGGSTVYSKTFFLKSLFSDDFSSNTAANYSGQGTKTVNAGALEIRGNDRYNEYRNIYPSTYENFYNETDYTFEFDFIPAVENSSIGIAFDATAIPTPDNADAKFIFDGSDGAAYYSGVFSAHNANHRLPTPWFSDPSQVNKGLEAGRTYHIKAAFQEGNKNLGVYLSSVVNGTEVEYKLYDWNVNSDGGAFAFLVNLKGEAMPEAGPYVTFDNVSVTKVLDVVDFQIENSESYPSGNEIILDAPCTVDSDSLDVSDFSVYTGTGVDKVELNISGVTSVDSDSVKLTLEQNIKNKVGYTLDVVGSLKSEGKEVVFRGVSFTVEPNEIDVESITKSENTYTAILKNYRAAETTVFATLAAYDENNKLIGISGGNYTLATDTAEENRKITLTAADASYVKCYILNGLANINTIAEEEFVAE